MSSVSSAPTPPRRLGWALCAGVGGFLALALGGAVLLVTSRAGPAAPPPKKEEAKDSDIDVVLTPTAKAGGPDPRILKAVEKGVAFLKRQLLEGETEYYLNDKGAGSVQGVEALAALTLLECGTAADDPAVVQVVNKVRSQARDLRFTYSICLCILLLDRLNQEPETDGKEPKGRRHEPLRKAAADPKYKADRDLIVDLTYQLVSCQNRTGGWGYFSEPPAGSRRGEIENFLARADLKGMVPGRDPPWPVPRAPVPGTLPPPSLVFYPGTDPGKYDDNSINQFVTLALWAARKHGLRTEPTLFLVEKRYRHNQNADGSWGYRQEANNLKDATTCAGLIGLAVGRGILTDGNAQALPPLAKDPAVQKGFEYLAAILGKKPPDMGSDEVYKRRRHAAETMALYRRWHQTPTDRSDIEDRIAELDDIDRLRGTFLDVDAWGDLYFLWSVERVGMIYSMDKIGGKDWYAWGMPLVLSQQKVDGSWRDRFPGIPDTCFALLFLKRANVAKDLTDKLRDLAAALTTGGPPLPPVAPVPETPPPRK